VKRLGEHPSRSMGFLSRYHDRELSAAEAAAFDRHAAECRECAAAAAEYEAILAMYRESGGAPADAGLARRISRRIDTELRRRPPIRFLALEIDLLWASIIAIGLVAAIALFAVLGKRSSGPVVVAENERAAGARPAPPIEPGAPTSRPAMPSAAGGAARNRPVPAPEPPAPPDESRSDRGVEGGVEGGVPGGVAGGVVGGVPAAGSKAETVVASPAAPRSTETPSNLETRAAPEARTDLRDMAAAPLRVGGAVAAPVLERRIEPDIPKSARRLLAASPVVVEAVISAEGDVVSTKIVRSNPAADRAVLDALRKWKYRPALLDGKPVAVYLTVTVRGE